MYATEQLPIGRVLTELAQVRGIFSLEELAASVNATTGEDFTAAELADWPRPGFGKHADRVLCLTEPERALLHRAVMERLDW